MQNIFFYPWLVIFCNQFGKEINRVFYLIHAFTLQFCCSSPTIKTHIISLQSVINNVYIFHMDRFEGKKKRRFQCENMHSVIIVVCHGKQSFFRFVSLLKLFLSQNKKNINSLRVSFNDLVSWQVSKIMRLQVHFHSEPFVGVIIPILEPRLHYVPTR